MAESGYNLIGTSSCVVGIVWLDKDGHIRIARIFLAKSIDAAREKIKIDFASAKEKRNRKINHLLKEINRYLKGETIFFDISLLQKEVCSEFQWDVCRRAVKIPHGRVITYKGLARLTGTKSARAVGNALARNPFPIMIPCHRVVSCNGGLGGFQSGLTLKKAILELEGITFDKKGRIPERFFI